MKQPSRTKFWYIFICAICVFIPHSTIAQTERVPNVLVLHSYHATFEWTQQISQGIYNEFNDTTQPVNLVIEYLDTKRQEPTLLFPYLKDLYQIKYQNMQFDVIITSDNNALDFLLTYRDEIFPDVPIVFCGLNNFDPTLVSENSNITGVVEDIDIAGTLELALNLHPNTTHIATISDATPTDEANRERLAQVKPQFEERVTFIDLAGLPAPKLQKALANLPNNTIILFFNLYRDREGGTLTLDEGITLATESRALPTYSLWQDKVEHGVLGGIIVSGKAQGQHAAQLALRILQRESPDTIPVIEQSPNEPMFNYEQLQRFNLRVIDLPEGYVLLNEPNNFGYRLQSYMLGMLAFISIETLIIILFLVNISRRKRAERALRENEKKYRTLFENMAQGAFYQSADGTLIDGNPAVLKMFGLTYDQFMGRTSMDPRWKVVGEDGEDLLGEQHPSMLAFHTGKPVENFVAGVFNPRREDFVWMTINAMPQFRPGETTPYQVFVTLHDITERKKAAETLRLNEEKYRALYDNAPLSYQSLDENGCFREINPTWLRTLGYDNDEVIGQWFGNFLHPDYVPHFEKNFPIFKKRGYVSNIQFKIRHKDKHYLDISFEGCASYYPDGSFRQTYCVFQDITQRKKAEQALRESENRFRQVYEHMAVGVARVTLDFHIEGANQAYCNMLGYSEAELIGKHLKDITAPEVLEQNLRKQTQLGCGEIDHYRLEKQFIHKDGHVVYGILDANLVRNTKGEPLYFLGSVLDITERKQSEKALQENEKLLRTIAENYPNSYLSIVESDFTIGFTSGQEFAKLGLNPEEFVGLTLEQVFGEQATTVRQHYIKTFEGQEQAFELFINDQYQYYRTVPLHTEEGHIPNILVVVENITKRKLAEEQLKHTLSEKETLLQELYHRTKNNMQVICALLDMQAARIDDEEIVNAFEVTKNRIHSMALVHQKLYQSQDLSRINLQEYIYELATLLLQSYQIPYNKIQLTFDLEDVFILIDTAIPCGIILNELISNALKYAFPKERHGEIKIDLHHTEDGMIDIQVSDNGVGVPTDFDFQHDGQLGLETVFALGEKQLYGEVQCEGQNGVTCRLRFKDDLYSQRV